MIASIQSDEIGRPGAFIATKPLEVVEQKYSVIRSKMSSASGIQGMGLRSWFRGLKKRRIMRQWGITSEQYDRINDPGINRRAWMVDGFYHGYPFVICWKDRERYDNDIAEVIDWCRESLAGPHRHDMHRVSFDTHDGISIRFDEFGGGDFWFFAFKDEKDATLFSLRWT